MKKHYLILIPLLINLCACNGNGGKSSSNTSNLSTSSSGSSLTPVGQYGKLSVCNRVLCNNSNQPVQLRGMSTHGIQWYGWGNCLTEESLDALAYDWGADILRISLYVQEGGYETNPTEYTNQVKQLIDEATDRGMYALVDWHQLTPGNPNANYNNAVNFFTAIATDYKDHINIIYDIANEPNGVTWNSIRNYAMALIPVIRNIDEDSVILIGTHGWASLGLSDGTDAQDIVDNPINYNNIMYTFHFYAASHDQVYRDNLLWAADRLPLFVSEWGTQTFTGDGTNNFTSAQAYLDILNEKNISWVNWNYSDDFRSGAVWNEGTCINNGPWTTENLKEAGLWVRDKILNR